MSGRKSWPPALELVAGGGDVNPTNNASRDLDLTIDLGDLDPADLDLVDAVDVAVGPERLSASW